MYNSETGREIRGKRPYHDATWGHIDLLEMEYGEDWADEIKNTSHWKRLDAGEDMRGLTGSVFWAICEEWRREYHRTRHPGIPYPG